jgi:hypothetical protein
MNEEWWGIAALGMPNADGVYEARPRMAYDVLTEVWSMDPYMFKKAAINQRFAMMNVDYYQLKAEVRELKAESVEKRKALSLTGGSLKFEMALKGNEDEIDTFGDDGDSFTDGQMAFIDFGFAPTKDIEGQFTINILANVADLEPLEIAYGRRGLPLQVQTIESIPEFGTDDEIEFSRELNDRERVEIYDFGGTYRGEYADIEMFYHTPRYHWKYEGDFFGLIREATDLDGMDIWNAKAPEGIEIASKGATQERGTKFVIGPEIYWGANPKAVLKHQSSLGELMPFLGEGLLAKTQYAIVLSEDFDRQGEGRRRFGDGRDRA